MYSTPTEFVMWKPLVRPRVPLCMTKVSRIQNCIVPRYEESIEMIRGILADIEIELDV